MSFGIPWADLLIILAVIIYGCFTAWWCVRAANEVVETIKQQRDKHR